MNIKNISQKSGNNPLLLRTARLPQAINFSKMSWAQLRTFTGKHCSPIPSTPVQSVHVFENLPPANRASNACRILSYLPYLLWKCIFWSTNHDWWSEHCSQNPHLPPRPPLKLKVAGSLKLCRATPIDGFRQEMKYAYQQCRDGDNTTFLYIFV